MAYYTNPYTGQASVIGALQSTQDIIRGLSEGYVRRKQAEREAEFHRLGVQLQGTQVQAEHTRRMAEIGTEQERYLRGLEESARREAADKEYRERTLGLTKRRFEEVELPSLAAEQRRETRLAAPEEESWVTPYELTAESVGEGTMAQDDLLDNIDENLRYLKMPREDIIELFMPKAQNARNSPAGIAYTNVNDEFNMMKSQLSAYIDSHPDMKPDDESYKKMMGMIKNPYIKVDVGKVTELDYTGMGEITTYKYYPYPDYAAISRDFDVERSKTSEDKLTEMLSKDANISSKEAADFITNEYVGEYDKTKHFYKDISADIYKQYMEYKKTTGEREAMPKVEPTSINMFPETAVPYRSTTQPVIPEKSAIPLPQRTAIGPYGAAYTPKIGASKGAMPVTRTQIPKEAIRVGISKVSGKPVYRLPDGSLEVEE